MSQDCPAGQWDDLVKQCFPKDEPEPDPEPEPPTDSLLTDMVQLRPTVRPVITAQVNSVMVLSPALWIFVMLATLGSILALALWFFIYRRQASPSSTSDFSQILDIGSSSLQSWQNYSGSPSASEDAEQQQEPLQKTEPPAMIHSLPSETNGPAVLLQRAAGAPSPCSHLHLGAQTGSQWEEGFFAFRDPTEHAGTEGGSGLPTCSTLSEHRIPLPATELGGTALVTTKTM